MPIVQVLLSGIFQWRQSLQKSIQDIEGKEELAAQWINKSLITAAF